MNTLRLEIINLHAPYRVKQREDKPQNYYFKTDYGVEYDISLTAEGKMEGQMNFMAIISRRDNPRLQEAIQEFEDTISFIFDWFCKMEEKRHAVS